LRHTRTQICTTLFDAYIFFLSLLSAAMNGITDAEKAKQAAVRIFDLIDRESEVDPLSSKGKKQD
jgi:hypothetical protein